MIEAVDPVQAGVLVVLLGSLFAIVRLFIASTDRNREEFFGFLNNHMGENTRAQRDTAAVLTELTESVKELRRDLR